MFMYISYLSWEGMHVHLRTFACQSGNVFSLNYDYCSQIKTIKFFFVARLVTWVFITKIVMGRGVTWEVV